MPVDLIDRADADRPAQVAPNLGGAEADALDGGDGAVSSAHVASSTTRRVMSGALILLSTQPVTWAASLLLVVHEGGLRRRGRESRELWQRDGSGWARSSPRRCGPASGGRRPGRSTCWSGCGETRW